MISQWGHPFHVLFGVSDADRHDPATRGLVPHDPTLPTSVRMAIEREYVERLDREAAVERRIKKIVRDLLADELPEAVAILMRGARP